MSHLIYIADDDPNICHIIQQQLINDGYDTEVFASGEDLLAVFNKKSCDLVITDIMMGGMSGYDLCREIRQHNDVPIIMVSAKDDEIDRILGLELGSDDYLSKPFSLRELSVKVRNMLRRRMHISKESTEDSLWCKDLELRLESREAYIHNEFLKTTTKEFDLLKLLVENINHAFSREQIIDQVWGYEYYGDTRQVDHLIKRLRKNAAGGIGL